MSQCATCCIPASRRCTGCKDAPEYEPGDAINIAYCSAECQSSDWKVHKSRCATLRKRRRLLHAATILKAALLTYREAFFDIPLAKIELRNGVLYLHRRPQSYISHRPFPRDLTTNVAHKEAALTHNQCTLALALLGPLARKLLTGVASLIENLDLPIGKPLVPTKLVDDHQAFSEGPHTVLKVFLRSSGETWIVDTSGCQYGFRDVLSPFDRYLADKCAFQGQPTSCSYTASETTDLDVIESLLMQERTDIGMRIMRDSFDQQRKGRLHFAAFVDQRVGSGKDCFDPSKDLDGSAPEFQRKFEKFTAELKTHMEGLVM